MAFWVVADPADMALGTPRSRSVLAHLVHLRAPAQAVHGDALQRVVRQRAHGVEAQGPVEGREHGVRDAGPARGQRALHRDALESLDEHAADHLDEGRVPHGIGEDLRTREVLGQEGGLRRGAPAADQHRGAVPAFEDRRHHGHVDVTVAQDGRARAFLLRALQTRCPGMAALPAAVRRSAPPEALGPA